MRRKRIATVVLAATMCLAFSGQKIRATDCPPHTPENRVEYTDWTNQHKVYRNIYLDGKQLYSICNVEGTYKWYVMRCAKCNEELHRNLGGTTESHSLANDPDHK